jgi:hypothetical protein
VTATVRPPAEAPAERELRDAWRAHGAAGGVLDELVAYSGRPFSHEDADGAHFPLEDEPFAAAWDGYVREAGECGAWPTLRDRLVQLRFPIAAGMSGRPEYLAATRRGIPPPAGPGLALNAPGELRLWMHPTPAGRIAVLRVPDRGDFESVVRALTARNEPRPVAASMGACIVSGYNNWDRVAALRRTWECAHPGAGEGEWRAELQSLAPRKELYQDRFILLSDGYYSATPPEALGVEPAEWLRLSRVIRLEHECAHYVMRRVFGSMRSSLHDELLADHAGITAAVGAFRGDWFLRFLGLEAHPRYRPGGRLENYRGTPPLSDAAFEILQAVVVRAAERLAAADPAPSGTAALMSIACTSLPELARRG